MSKLSFVKLFTVEKYYGFKHNVIMAEKLNSLPPVAEMMRGAGLEPKRQLGQNFLFDLNLTLRIARAVPDIENTTVIEVGPGPGGLTRALLSLGAKRVIAIEKDKTTASILEQISAASDDRLEIIFADALKLFEPLQEECGKGVFHVSEKIASSVIASGSATRNDIHNKYAICSNLPYNIGTELLIRWLRMDNISSMTLMFQREVAQRIVAKVGNPQYGRLSVLTSLTADAKILFDVPNTAFVPRPKVQSAVVQIFPRSRIECITKVERLTAKLFGQRRKMIRGIMPDINWPEFGLTGRERAEELSPEKFAEIAAKIMI
ncbi:MAG: 16S rRNA (adenine(1518)-N(6)/adenine(1519)-N(6))-dimethyltransferase RsmA [Alphaproteobacteria bacterium]|nr:16S rRNA (adenine(1518)-N(6)/adenine(1519)-N(6))-dimethyltransferase RsmA [Alphaproteobacteria bacterium]